jgi:hypothetical protein
MIIIATLIEDNACCNYSDTEETQPPKSMEGGKGLRCDRARKKFSVDLIHEVYFS